MKVKRIFGYAIVYGLLSFGIVGVLLMDVMWQKAGYLLVITLMIDILYNAKLHKLSLKRTGSNS